MWPPCPQQPPPTPPYCKQMQQLLHKKPYKQTNVANAAGNYAFTSTHLARQLVVGKCWVSADRRSSGSVFGARKRQFGFQFVDWICMIQLMLPLGEETWPRFVFASLCIETADAPHVCPSSRLSIYAAETRKKRKMLCLSLQIVQSVL